MKKDNLVNKTYKMSVELCDDVSQNTENILKLKKEISTIHNHSHPNKTILDNITASYSTLEQAKLLGIETDAQKNVQSNWSEQDASNDSYIKNKPNIPANDSDLINDRYVRYDISSQNLNSTQQSNARENIGAVPATRTINSKSLSGDITLTASDVGAVPTTRTINSKALSSNIALDASDVGAEPAISLTTGRALVSNSSGKVAVSDVTSTELGYLDGVTSAIQTQLNGKQETLVSGTNIKTINSTSLLGGGDISIHDITKLSAEYIRITNLETGIYKCTYTSGVIKIYYKGTTLTDTVSVTSASYLGENYLYVIKQGTRWSWWFVRAAIFSTSWSPQLYYGETHSTDGHYGFVNLDNIPKGVMNNLTTTESMADYALSAYQGKVLKDEIDTLPDTAITSAEIDALFS